MFLNKLLSSIIFDHKSFVIWKNLASSWSSQVFVILLSYISDWCLEETAKRKIDLIAGILFHAL